MDLDEDLDCLDGWDELPDWARSKIKDSLVNGHVADEDWKGVSFRSLNHGLWQLTF